MTADTLELPHGVSFGDTLEEVTDTIEAAGLELVPAPISTTGWIVEGADFPAFYFCEQLLSSVDQGIEGGLVEFIDTVFNLRWHYGEPETNVTILSPGSSVEMHVISSEFQIEDRERIAVQIMSRNDSERVWSRWSNATACELDN